MAMAAFLTFLLVSLAVLCGGILAWTTAITGGIACVVWTWHRFKERSGSTTSPVEGPRASIALEASQSLLAGTFVLYLVLSILPLPQSWFGGSPIRTKQHHFMQERLYDARDANLCDIGKPTMSLTRNRAGTSRMILLTITTVVCAALASRIRPQHHASFIQTLVIMSTALAVAGVMSQWVFPQGKNLWWIVPVDHGKPIGCFINRNHFGGYLGLFVPAGLIITATSMLRGKWIRGLGWAFCTVLLLGAIFLSQSRGAWLATAAGLCVVCVLMLRQKATIGAVVLLLGLAMSVGTGFLLRDNIAERFSSLRDPLATVSGQMRLDTWDDCIPLFRQYPILGAGGNAFRMVFPQVRSADTRQSFANAENEYLQILVELGVLGTGVALLLAGTVIRRWFLNRSAIPLDVHASVLGATVVCLVHACFDFAVRVPLYAITMACLIGMTQRSAPGGRASVSDGHRRIYLPVIACITLACISLQGRRIYEWDSPGYFLRADRDSLARIITWAPTSPWAWFHFGRTAMQVNDYDVRVVAERCVTAATMYDPNNYLFWRELANLRFTLGDKPGARAAYDRLKELRAWAGSEELETGLSSTPGPKP